MAGASSLIIYNEIVSQKGGEGERSETITVTLQMELHMCRLFDVTINHKFGSKAEVNRVL